MVNPREAHIKYLSPSVVTVSGKCIVTGEEYTTASFPVEQLNLYMKGELAQKCLKNLGPGDREFLISGCSPNGWTKLYGKEEMSGED